MLEEEMVKPSDLHMLWTAPDNTRLTAQAVLFSACRFMSPPSWPPWEISIRVRSRTELVGDLLATALDAVEQSLPYTDGAVIVELPDGEKVCETLGLRRDFWNRANAHYQTLEPRARQ
jgi:hypothetical protein